MATYIKATMGHSTLHVDVQSGRLFDGLSEEAKRMFKVFIARS